MRRSPHQFTGIGSLSPTLWLARGYAVLDGPGFPIVAEGDEEPNDTYVEQLTASAEAAVKVGSVFFKHVCRSYLQSGYRNPTAQPLQSAVSVRSFWSIFLTIFPLVTDSAQHFV
jgi:hypothetical protein